MAYRALTNQDLSTEELYSIVDCYQDRQRSVENIPITKEEFLLILSEYKNKEQYSSNKFWDILMSRASSVITTVASPINKVIGKVEAIIKIFNLVKLDKGCRKLQS